MARLHLVVSPGANRDDLERRPDGSLHAHVTARATEGKANRALLTLLANRLQVPKTSISIARGEASRHKIIDVPGLREDELFARLWPSEGNA